TFICILNSLSLLSIRRPPTPTLFPYTTLFRSLDAKTALDTALADARYNGQIEGKNEADREAHARQLFGELYEAATEAERQVIVRSEEHTSELQSRENLVCRLLLEQKKNTKRRL